MIKKKNSKYQKKIQNFFVDNNLGENSKCSYYNGCKNGVQRTNNCYGATTYMSSV